MFKLLYLIIKDLFTIKKKRLHLYGIRLVVGLYGGGKTMYMTWYLNKMRNKYKNKIVIATNYNFKYQDHPINSWHDLLALAQQCNDLNIPLLVGYDEIQNEFTSRDYKNFPTELLSLLTQNRKGAGVQIIATAQRYRRVDIIWRELSERVITVSTYFGRLTLAQHWNGDDYELINAMPDKNFAKSKAKRMGTDLIVQTDELRNMYDSFKMLKTAFKKEYDMSEYRKNLEKNF